MSSKAIIALGLIKPRNIDIKMIREELGLLVLGDAENSNGEIGAEYGRHRNKMHCEISFANLLMHCKSMQCKILQHFTGHTRKNPQI